MRKVYLLTLIIVLAFILGGCGEDSKTQEVKEGMEAYLKRNYQMEFEVGKPYLTGNKGFGYYYEVKAFPKGQPELEFFVEGDKSNSGVYVDNYLQVLWTSQGRKEVEKELKELYGEDFFLESYDFRYNNKEHKNLDYTEVVRECDGWAYISISYLVFLNEGINLKSEAEKAYKILKTHLLDHKIKRYDLAISFLPIEYKKSPSSFSEEINKNNKRLADLYKERKLLNHVHIYDTALDNKEIKEVYVSDIIESFEFE